MNYSCYITGAFKRGCYHCGNRLRIGVQEVKITIIRHLTSDNIQQWDNQLFRTRTDKHMTNFKADY